MSCQQQLIQEDPYVFTDTISNSTNFMHENNSQTKYVPLNRQTIYNRQFRQHEPTISLTDSNNGVVASTSPLLSKSTTFSDQPQQQQQKIIINPSSLKDKKNGLNNGNGKILAASPSSSPRTSPKFFKSHQPQLQSSQNEKNILVSNSPIKNHSIASVSKIQLQNQNQQHFQQNVINKITTLNHVSHSSSLSLPNTGIKKEVSNEDNSEDIVDNRSTMSVVVKVEKNAETKREENFESTKAHNRNNLKKSKRTNKRKEKLSLKHSQTRSQNVIVEPISIPRNAPQVQSELNVIDKRLLQNYRYGDSESKHLTRDERLNMRKLQLRHILNQYRGVNQMQQKSTEEIRMKFDKTSKLLKMLDRTKEKIFKKSITVCNMRDCKEEAIVSSEYCLKHILTTDKEQFLIRQCCFVSDGHQCRVPVSDIMATVAVCKEHFDAPSHQLIINSNSNSNNFIIDSTKPKKPPIQRKQRTKTSPLIRPNKKCGVGSNGKTIRKKKSDLMIPVHRPTMIIHPSDLHKPAQQAAKNKSNNVTLSLSSSSSSSLSSSTLPLKQENLQSESNHQFIHQNSGFLLASSQSSYGSMSSGNEDLYLKRQDLITGVCENSYESSEDTGVGGLSENELISHDVIGNFDMESCAAELSKVLSSLPSNTLDDLLTEPLHTSRDDEEYLDRAIEEVSATGMDQIAITAFEHLEGLDMLEMLDDDEQRQMISAATNLISMSGYMSTHDQDNNFSMPSPMMS